MPPKFPQELIEQIATQLYNAAINEHAHQTFRRAIEPKIAHNRFVAKFAGLLEESGLMYFSPEEKNAIRKALKNAKRANPYEAHTPLPNPDIFL